MLFIRFSVARRGRRTLVGIFYENRPIRQPFSCRVAGINLKLMKKKTIVEHGTTLALAMPSFIGPEEAEWPPGEGRASQPWMGCPPGDRSEGKDEEQGASREECWLRNAPKQNNDKNKKQRSMSNPGPALRGFFF
jgi:hypothetical protein